jgi:hypothetical protein
LFDIEEDEVDEVADGSLVVPALVLPEVVWAWATANTQASSEAARVGSFIIGLVSLVSPLSGRTIPASPVPVRVTRRQRCNGWVSACRQRVTA